MGYMSHHAIVVTSWSDEYIQSAHALATGIFPSVSSVLRSQVNDYWSFFIPPDGSKDGWKESSDGDTRREQFIKRLREQYCEDGSSHVTWAEVQYGDDNKDSKVTRSSDFDYLASRFGSTRT